ncbi:MAG: hypothetical protein ACT4OZ_11350 [Gemmatimonadota bacterium]
MATRRVAARRARSRIAVGLIAFLTVATIVIARRSSGVARARALHDLDRQRSSLESERARLVNEIRSATSLGRLLPVVSARLGMRVPADSQLVRLRRPAAPDGGRS